MQNLLFGPYNTDVIRVVVGDTLELNVHIWPGLIQNIKLRLDGIDTPEKRGKYIRMRERSRTKTNQFFPTFG